MRPPHRPRQPCHRLPRRLWLAQMPEDVVRRTAGTVAFRHFAGLSGADSGADGAVALTVYVDDMHRYPIGRFKVGRYEMKMSHMIADAEDELRESSCDWCRQALVPARPLRHLAGETGPRGEARCDRDHLPAVRADVGEPKDDRISRLPGSGAPSLGGYPGGAQRCKAVSGTPSPPVRIPYERSRKG
jgi:hypothetical protein